MPGRPRKPTKLHVLEGTFREERHAARGEEIETGPLGAAPEWMTEIARAEWDRLTGNATYGALLQSSDWAPFVQYCVLYERMILDAQGVRPMAATERNTFHSICMQLGMTPAARAKVAMPGEQKAKSKWDGIAKAR